MVTDDIAIRVADTLSLGNRLLKEFGLDDWTFDLNNEKVTLGRCFHDEKKITYSWYFINQPMEEIEDTIRHEIAHALVGPRHGHDHTWRMMCLRVGAKPERLAGEDVTTAAKPNYVIECKGCGQRWPRFRLKRSLAKKRSICCHEPFNFYRVK